MSNPNRLMIPVLITTAVVASAVIIAASRLTNDGGTTDRFYTDAEILQRRKDIEILIELVDYRICKQKYRMGPKMFTKLHNYLLLAEDIEESTKLPLFLQLAIFLNYIGHDRSFSDQNWDFRVS